MRIFERKIRTIEAKERENFAFPLTDSSIGLATVQAYGHELDRPVYIESNFATPPDVAIAGIIGNDEPAHEASLSATSLRPGEIGIVPQQVLGVTGYWHEVGIIPQGASVHEVELHHEGDDGFHFPHTDVIQQAKKQGSRLQGHLVSSFPHGKNKETAKQLGLHAIQAFEAGDVGDKGVFHRAAEVYGFSTPYAAEVYSREDIKKLYIQLQSEQTKSLFADRPQRIWVKLRNSSGGEGVGSIDEVNTLSFLEFQTSFAKISERFYGNAQLAFSNGDRRDAVNYSWDSNTKMPYEGLIVELDTNANGPSDGQSYSNILYIDTDGAVREIAEFVQLIGPDGQFLGSSLSTIINKVVGTDSEMGRVGKYFYDQGVRGSIGTDYKRVLTDQGVQKIFIDPNIRPSMSHHALIAFENILRHLQAKEQNIEQACFANTVIHIPNGIRSIEDIRRVLGDYFYTGDAIDMGKGCVAPIGVGSYIADGKIIASKDTRILIIGKDAKHCVQIIASLKEKGL